MRMYQEIGLKPEAEDFLNKNAVKVPISYCPHCNGVLSYGFNVLHVEHHDSFYGDGPHLRSIELKDERVAKEIIQAEPWSSGPVCFLCLEVNDIRMFEWAEEDIDVRI